MISIKFQIKTIKTEILLCLMLMLSSCQTFTSSPSYPHEASLVANSFENGLSTEINLDYQTIYFRLRQAYQYCIAYTDAKNMIFTDNRFEPDLQMGTLFARTGEGDYLYKMLVEGLKNGQTRLTLFLPKMHRAAHQRFQQDIRWALAEKSQCSAP